MVEVLRVLLGVLVVASLVTIAVYLLVSMTIAAMTVLVAVRRDKSVDELDQVLAEILGPRETQTVADP